MLSLRHFGSGFGFGCLGGLDLIFGIPGSSLIIGPIIEDLSGCGDGVLFVILHLFPYIGCHQAIR